MITLLITIVVLALVIYVINLLVPEVKLRNILIAVVVILVMLYLLGGYGVYDGIKFNR